MSEKKNLYQRINQVMKEVKTIYKATEVSMGKGSYSAVSHDDVTALLHGPIVEAGLIAFPNMESNIVESNSYTDKHGNNKVQYKSTVRASVTFINIDNPDEKIVTHCEAIGFDSSDKGTGKAYSMALKYCYLKTFMLESSDNEEDRIDEDGVTVREKNKKQEADNKIQQEQQQAQQQQRQAFLDQQKAIISDIINKVAPFINTLNPQGKNQFLQEVLHVKKSTELNGKSIEELNEILIKASEVVINQPVTPEREPQQAPRQQVSIEQEQQQYHQQEQHPQQNERPTFTLETQYL